MISDLDYQYSEVKNEKYSPRTTIANAIYTKASLKNDEGNPLIECLPPVLKFEQYAEYLANVNIPCTQKADRQTKLDEIGMLEQVRFPLAYAPLVDEYLRGSFLCSFREKWKNTIKRNIAVTIGDETEVQSVMANTAGGGDSGNGFAVIGVSGSGKSETINRLLERYPNVIVHNWGLERLTQILWIKVNAPANGSLDSLYVEVGAAIDDVLGNENGRYAYLVSKQKRVDDKANVIANLIRRFSIGAIVFDEIQNLKPERNKPSSFKSLLSLTNPTKVALIVLGTKEAYDVVFQEYYVARRIKDKILTSVYCENRENFDFYATELMQYQWTKKKYEITKPMLDAMFQETRGVIERMVTIWMAVQRAMVSAQNEPELNAAFILKVAANEQPLMSVFISEAIKAEKGKETLLDIINDSSPKTKRDVLIRQDTIAKILGDLPNQVQAHELLTRAKSHFQYDNLGVCPYNDSKIAKAIAKVLKTKKYENEKDDKLLQIIITRVKQAGKDYRQGNPNLEPPNMNGLLDFGSFGNKE